MVVVAGGGGSSAEVNAVPVTGRKRKFSIRVYRNSNDGAGSMVKLLLLLL